MKPDLSVAMIFKNEIRCLERCMKSLQPLRERISVEIVMADTGSTDGSRVVAEQYADVVFDFPWVNDFSAARNAVLDHCTGAWALVIDCDEWLDENIAELVTFLKGSRRNQFDEVLLAIRNYSTAALNEYGESRAYRLLNLASKPRFEGTIHESPEFPNRKRNAELDHTFLHHDGYVVLNDGSEAGEAKRRRNVALLRAELEKTPDDLRRLMQYLESADEEPDHDEQLRRAAALTDAKTAGWERYGALLLSYAVQTAYQRSLPELDDWTALAFARFPDSYFTRIDVAYIAAARAFEQREFETAARYAESYLQARRAYAGDSRGHNETAVGVLQRDDDDGERDIRTVLARSYPRLGQTEKALAMLENWAWEETDARQVRNFLIALQELKAYSDIDIMPVLMECRERIGKPVPSAERARERVAAFEEICSIRDSGAKQEIPAELLQLAEKVKAILAKLPPDDPMAAELKSSEAYQKIAWLIEKDNI